MSKKEKAKVHKDLEGLDFSVDSFGEIKSSMPVDQINKFLNKNVEDKKLQNREDLNDLKEGK